jgi:hypothetical protein
VHCYLLQDAEAHLQHHFESIQDIADTTTLPSLLPALSRALLASADVEAPLERLRWVVLILTADWGRTALHNFGLLDLVVHAGVDGVTEAFDG